MPECCAIHFTGWYCPKCGLPISFADHGGSTPISIGNISTKNVTINQQLVQGDLIQAGGIKSTGRGNEVPESFALPLPPPPFEKDDLPLPPPPAEDDLPLPPPPAIEELPSPPSLVEDPESTVKNVDNSEEIWPPTDAEIITDELGVEWFEENGKWYYKNPEDNWELFQT